MILYVCMYVCIFFNMPFLILHSNAYVAKYVKTGSTKRILIFVWRRVQKYPVFRSENPVIAIRG